MTFYILFGSVIDLFVKITTWCSYMVNKFIAEFNMTKLGWISKGKADDLEASGTLKIELWIYSALIPF